MTKNNDGTDELLAVQTRFNEYESQYNLLLQQYNVAYKEFTIALDESNISYKNYSGSVWWGNGNVLDQGNVDSMQECADMCTNNSSCTGATYSSDKQYCWISSGMGQIKPGLENDYAIIPLIQDKLRTLNSINSQLLDINKKMNKVLEELEPIAKEEFEKKEEKKVELKSKNDTLENQQDEILALIAENESLQEQYNNNQLVVSQQNSMFKIWLIIVLILGSLVVKMFLKPTKTNNIILLLILFFLCVVVYNYFN